jgi:hypothetical protein
VIEHNLVRIALPDILAVFLHLALQIFQFRLRLKLKQKFLLSRITKGESAVRMFLCCSADLRLSSVS